MAGFVGGLRRVGGILLGSDPNATGQQGGFSRGKRLVLLGVLLCLPLAILLAVHDIGLFELDGNAVDGAAPGDDWANVFNGTSGASQTLFIGAATEANSSACPIASCNDISYFTGGGSKDNNDIPQWQYSPGDVSPDKDTITDAFAAVYPTKLCSNAAATICASDSDCPAGGLCQDHEILYFGADRFSNGGDSQIGFWFFTSAVGLNPLPASGNGTFSGVHMVGDLLVLSDSARRHPVATRCAGL